MKTTLLCVLDAVLAVIAMWIATTVAIISVITLSGYDLRPVLMVAVPLAVGILAGAVYVSRAPDLLKRRKRRRAFDTVFWFLSFIVLYMFGTSLIRPPHSIQVAVLETMFNPLTWALLILATVRIRAGNSQPTSVAVPVAGRERKPNGGDGRLESVHSDTIAVLIFELHGPRTWHPAVEKPEPISHDLVRDDAARRLEDFYIGGRLAPLWVREQFDFPAGDLGSGWALIIGWLTFLESQVWKLPKHLQDFVLRSIETDIAAYYDNKYLPPHENSRRNYFNLGTVHVTVYRRVRYMAIVKWASAHMRDVDLVALVFALSFSSVARALTGDQLRWFMFLTSYGLWKWKNEKLPHRPGDSGKSTWDFSDLSNVVDDAIRGGLLISKA